MTAFAATRAIEERFSSLRIAGEQLFKRILAGYAAGVQGFGRAGVKVSGDIEDLLLSQHQSRHTFIGTAETNDFADLVTLHVMSHQRRAYQVGRTGAGGVKAVAKSAGLLEGFVSALNGRVGSLRLGPSTGMLHKKQEKNSDEKKSGLGELALPCEPVLASLHSACLRPISLRPLECCRIGPTRKLLRRSASCNC